jgi:protein-disulfide isomerase
VRVIFKNRPLSLYAGSEMIHEAAMVAASKNKFWEMEQLLANRRSPAQRSDLLSYAVKLGMDKAEFAAAIDSGSLRGMVAGDLLEAKELDVRGSPTFFVNDTRVDGVPSSARMKALVDSEISRLHALLSRTSADVVFGAKPAAN